MENMQGGESGDDVKVPKKSRWVCDVWTRSSMIMMMRDPPSSSWRTRGRALLVHAARIIVIAALLFIVSEICFSDRSIIRPAFFLESRDRSPDLLQLREPQESLASGSTAATITAGPSSVIISSSRRHEGSPNSPAPVSVPSENFEKDQELTDWTTPVKKNSEIASRIGATEGDQHHMGSSGDLQPAVSSDLPHSPQPERPLLTLPGALDDSRGAIPTVLNENRMRLQQDLSSARKDIQTATPADSDPSLYPSVYRNVGTFSKSYKLMMKKFRIYVYQEGGRNARLVHVGPMTGPNCIEGRFIKNMMKRDSSSFIEQDPERAHMFYLPYSMEQIRKRLWNKSSNDNLGTLIRFVNDYVEEVATKHPFWNRSRGRDHFIVACTDWGPHSVRGQQELRANTVKAVCNADLNEEFVVGKDVAVPVLRLGPPRPYGFELGGPPPSKRSYLAFFAGGKHGDVRQALLWEWEGKDPDMKIFDKYKQLEGNLTYGEYMRNSKYCICAAGWYMYSPRTTESIYNDCVPVIIADREVLPFSDVLDWTKFSVRVTESDIPNLKAILLAIPESQYLALQRALSKVRQHFVWNDPPVKYDTFHMILHGLWTARLNQLAIL